jgi:hypothetical protein
MRIIAPFALALSCLLTATAATAAPPTDAVGMVLDVRGSGQVSGKGPVTKLRLLGYVKVGEQIQLDPNSKASVSHYGSKLIYQLTGPLVADVDVAKITVRKGGASPVTRSVAEKLVAAAIDPNMSAAATKMRSLFDEVVMIAPSKSGVLLSTRPTFRWEASGNNNYLVTVDELPERELARTTTGDKNWQLPAGIALEHGKSYRWTVGYTDGAGNSFSGSAVFKIASASDSAAMLALKPGPEAGIEDWVLYANILDERRMHEDANGIWQLIAVQRPDLAASRPVVP